MMDRRGWREGGQGPRHSVLPKSLIPALKEAPRDNLGPCTKQICKLGLGSVGAASWRYLKDRGQLCTFPWELSSLPPPDVFDDAKTGQSGRWHRSDDGQP